MGNYKIKDLLKTNCFDIQETMIIVGGCLKKMQPKAYKELENAIDISNIEIINYVAVNNILIEIPLEI
jgi:hypothetical protein